MSDYGSYRRNRSGDVYAGTSISGLLGVAFVVMKLTGHLDDWSWWWVLSPFWLPPAIVLGVFALGFLVYLAWLGTENYLRARQGKVLRHQHGPRARWGKKRRPPFDVGGGDSA